MTDAEQQASSPYRVRRQRQRQDVVGQVAQVRPDDGALDLKGLLAAAPLEGVDLERDQRSGRSRKGSDPKTSPYPLRLPVSLKAAVERLSKRGGTSMSQFMVVAVAEKIAAMTTEEVITERRARADRTAFRRVLDREGGEPPRPEDELPPDPAQLGSR